MRACPLPEEGDVIVVTRHGMVEAATVHASCLADFGSAKIVVETMMLLLALMVDQVDQADQVLGRLAVSAQGRRDDDVPVFGSVRRRRCATDSQAVSPAVVVLALPSAVGTERYLLVVGGGEWRALRRTSRWALVLGHLWRRGDAGELRRPQLHDPSRHLPTLVAVMVVVVGVTLVSLWRWARCVRLHMARCGRGTARAGQVVQQRRARRRRKGASRRPR